MSVMNTKYDLGPYHHDVDKCSLCDEPLHFPFLFWREGGPSLCICGTCCQKIKGRFIADLIQVAAIMDINALGLSDNVRLIRKATKVLEVEGEKREQEGIAAATIPRITPRK